MWMRVEGPDRKVLSSDSMRDDAVVVEVKPKEPVNTDFEI